MLTERPGNEELRITFISHNLISRIIKGLYTQKNIMRKIFHIGKATDIEPGCKMLGIVQFGKAVPWLFIFNDDVFSQRVSRSSSEFFA